MHNIFCIGIHRLYRRAQVTFPRRQQEGNTITVAKVHEGQCAKRVSTQDFEDAILMASGLAPAMQRLFHPVIAVMMFRQRRDHRFFSKAATNSIPLEAMLCINPLSAKRDSID